MAEQIANPTVERYIIKCMFNSPASIVEIAQTLKKDDFTNMVYQSLFVAIKKLSIGGDVSAESIMAHLGTRNPEAYEGFKRKGGAKAIEEHLRDKTLGESPSVSEQIKELKWLTYRRDVLKIADKIKTYATSNVDGDSNIAFDDVEQMDEKIKEDIYNLADNISMTEKIETIGSVVDQLRAEIKSGETMGIDITSIGFPKLNRLIKRLRNGALYVFGAPEKVGKSTFMLDLAWKIAWKLNIPVAYGDTEMSTEEVLLRIVSKMSGIEEDRIADNMLDKDEQKIVDARWEQIKSIPFFHFNCNELTNAELESKVKLLQLKHGIQLFVYDYIKIQSFEAEKGRPDLILASKLDCLKERICKQCNIPVITSGQMYPRTDDRGQLNKFAETSHFTKLADVICRLDRCEADDPNAMGTHYIELIMGRKVRTTDIGKRIEYDFNPPIHQIKEL